MHLSEPKIIVALDQATEGAALDFLAKLDPALCRVKIGSILFTHYGPELLEKITQKGFEIFLDLKFHDIPQTVAGACLSAAQLGVWMVNIHASGGSEMMRAARTAIQSYAGKKPLLIGVTILTSLSDNDLTHLGYRHSTAEMVLHLANSAYQAGLDGVVCSAHEVGLLRKHLPKKFLLVVPGIRLQKESQDDQKRIMSPNEAFSAGADYLVIGRPITQSLHPRDLLVQINNNSL